MIGAQKNSLHSINKLVMIFLFALVGFVLGSCGQYKDKNNDAPASAEGDTTVRKQYLDNLDSRGLAKKGETTFRARNFANFNFDGCVLVSEQVRHQIESTTTTETRISVKYKSPVFKADRGDSGKPCVSIYNKFRKDETLVLDTEKEIEFRRSFIGDGCEWVKSQLGKSLPDVEMKNCKITFARESDFAGEQVGSAQLEALFVDSNDEYQHNQKYQFFLNKLLWVDSFEKTGVGYITDSDGVRSDYSFRENLSGIASEEKPNSDLNSKREVSYSSEQQLLKDLKKSLK